MHYFGLRVTDNPDILEVINTDYKLVATLSRVVETDMSRASSDSIPRQAMYWLIKEEGVGKYPLVGKFPCLGEALERYAMVWDLKHSAIEN